MVFVCGLKAWYFSREKVLQFEFTIFSRQDIGPAVAFKVGVVVAQNAFADHVVDEADAQAAEPTVEGGLFVVARVPGEEAPDGPGDGGLRLDGPVHGSESGDEDVEEW